jgi:hypothetical protein
LLFDPNNRLTPLFSNFCLLPLLPEPKIHTYTKLQTKLEFT